AAGLDCDMWILPYGAAPSAWGRVASQARRATARGVSAPPTDIDVVAARSVSAAPTDIDVVAASPRLEAATTSVPPRGSHDQNVGAASRAGRAPGRRMAGRDRYSAPWHPDRSLRSRRALGALRALRAGTWPWRALRARTRLRRAGCPPGRA